MDAQDPRSDEELFRQYSDGGDCNALGSLFHRRADELLRIAAFLAPRPTEAEDLVQATFLSAIAHADQFRRDGRVMSWLCGILTNHARMLRRSERRRPPVAKDQVVEDPAEAALRSELQSALVGSIGRLPEPYRSVLKLHVENGLDSSEIGERLQRPPATVRKQIERALDRLRLALPFGLAAAITARVDAAALARHAADAAQFVERSPLAPTAPETTAAPTAWFAARIVGLAAAIGVLALLAEAFWPNEIVDVAPAKPAIAQVQPAPTATTPGAGATGTAAAARTPAAGFEVLVACVDEAGAPVTGVEVLAAYVDGRILAERLLDGDGMRTAVTDATGIARLASMAPGLVDFTTAGYPVGKRVRIDAADASCTLSVPRPESLQGIVVDERGRGVGGVELRVSMSSMRADLGHAFATTRSDGTFVGATHVTAGHVFAQHPEYGAAQGVAAMADAPLRIVLPPRRPDITARVMDESGHAIAGAHVAAIPKVVAGSYLPAHHARTDATGACVLPDAGTPVVDLVARAAGFAPAVAALAADGREVTLVATRGVAVRGRVVRANGTPVAGVAVHVGPIAGAARAMTATFTQQSAETDGDGRFRVSGIPEGPVFLRASAGAVAGFDGAKATSVLAAMDTKAAADAPEHVLVARDAPSIRGRLVDETGRPLAGWHVVGLPAIELADHRLLRNRETVTDLDGWFILADLANEARYHLGAWPAGAADRLRTIPLELGSAVSGEAGLQFTVNGGAPRRELAVRVLDGAGNVPVDCQLTLRSPTLRWNVGRRPATDGAYVWRDLPAGPYELLVASPTAGTTTVQLQVGSESLRTDLGVVTLAEPATARVRLVGTLVPGSRIRLLARPIPGETFRIVESNAAGEAELAPLPPGPVEVVADGVGIAPCRRRFDLAAGLNTLELEVTPSATALFEFAFAVADNPFAVDGPLHLRISDHDGALAHECAVGKVVEPGRFRIALGLPEGNYRVTATSIWNATGSVGFRVPASGATAPIRVVLAR
jgi:RNA polymerase sigma-70 factor, ECF subfamily